MFRLMMVIVLAAAAAAKGQTGARGPGAPRPIHHVVVAGDLDSARVVAELEASLRRAAEADAETLVLELAGNRWRPDVIHRIGEAIRSTPVRTAVWLRDPKRGSVGVGQALLGLIATECWIEPGTRVEAHASDDRRELAPRGTDHVKLLGELRRWAGERGAESDGPWMDPLVVTLLLEPPAPMWAVADDGEKALRITLTEPANVGGTRHSGARSPRPPYPLTREVRDDRGAKTYEAEIVAEAAVGLGLAKGRASYLVNIFEARGVKLGTPVRETIKVDLERILKRAPEALAALDRELEAINSELRKRPRDDRVVTDRFYRESGNAGLKRLREARERLDACERLLMEDPEIERTPPPGTSRMVSIDSYASEWRSELTARRARIEVLERRARGLAER